jgi:HK97 family phage major capsid protein
MDIDLQGYEAVKVRTGICYRSAEIVVRAAGDSEQKQYDFVCSSEAPVENRWLWDEENEQYYYGTEVLLHGPENVDMSWISSGNAPFLKDHELDEQVGVITGAVIEDRRMRVTGLKFSRSVDGVEMQQDIDDGIRKNVSIGYIIQEIVEVQAARGNSPGVYHATKWKPYEVSSVSIPAVDSVGFGRSAGKRVLFDAVCYRVRADKFSTGEDMAGNESEGMGVATGGAQLLEVHGVDRDLDRIGQVAELNRAIFQGGVDIATRAIASKLTFDEFWKEYQPALLAESQRQATVKIGMTDKDKRQFSLIRLSRALDVTDHDVTMKDAGFEVEVSQEYCKARGISAQRGGVVIPLEAIPMQGRAAIISSTTGAGAVQEIHSGEVIEYLRAQSVLAQAGARFINGLVGKFDMGRVGVGSTAYWVGEVDETGSDVTASSLDIDLLQFTIKTIGAWQGITRQMGKQTSLDVEGIVRGDLYQALADGIDKAGLVGSGSSNQPTGICYTSGVGTRAFATAQTPLWSDMVLLETTVAEANGLRGSLAYVASPTLIGLMKGTQRATSLNFVVEGNECNGYPILRSTNAIKSTVKNVIFGNWQELMVGSWGGLEIVVDPYTYARKGVVGLTAFQDVDIQLRHAASFIYTTN